MGQRAPSDDKWADLKWSSNSLMKPPELKPWVINIDWGLNCSEHVLGLSASLSTRRLEGFVNKLLKLCTKRQVMFPCSKLSLDDASTLSEVSGDWRRTETHTHIRATAPGGAHSLPCVGVFQLIGSSWPVVMANRAQTHPKHTPASYYLILKSKNTGAKAGKS